MMRLLSALIEPEEYVTICSWRQLYKIEAAPRQSGRLVPSENGKQKYSNISRLCCYCNQNKQAKQEAESAIDTVSFSAFMRKTLSSVGQAKTSHKKAHVS